MESLSRLLSPIIGSTSVGSFHLNSNSHRSGDCPCKLLTKSSSIWTAAETNDYEAVCSRIAQNSALISKCDAYGYTALHYAAQHNHSKIVEFLLFKGCLPDTNTCGATALHRAAYSGSVESCELLLKAGADVNAVDSSYRDMGSPLHKAYTTANVSIVALLLKYGANSIQPDAAGLIPEQLLKKKYLHLFQSAASSSEDVVMRDAVHVKDAAMSPLRGEDQNGLIDCNTDNITTETASSSSATDLVGPITDMGKGLSQWESIGLECCRCHLKCLSFTRCTDGSLICIDCKYKDPRLVQIQ